jgi:glycosyltransferase involved in cell wall biosynthesis
MPHIFANTTQEVYFNTRSIIPVVSVVVVTYNHGDWIEECLDGILNQNFPDEMELLLVDHSSSDGTFEIAVNFWKARGGFQAIFLKKDRTNMKRVNGRPTGNGNFIEMVMKARGKYVAICSGDDTWIRPDKLSLQTQLLRETKGATIVWSDVFIGPNLESARQSDGAKERFHLEDYRYGNPNGDAASSTLFIRESLNISAFGSEFSSVPYEDWTLHMLCLENGHGVRLQQPTTLYRQHSRNMMKSVVNELNLIEWVQSLNYYSDYFQQLDYSKLRDTINERISAARMNRVESDLKAYINNLPLKSAMFILFKRAVTRWLYQLGIDR